MPEHEWVKLITERDAAAGMLALVGVGLCAVVICTPRRWRGWVLAGLALYAIVVVVSIVRDGAVI